MQSSRHPPGAAKVFVILASNTWSEECFAPYNRQSSSAGSGRLLGLTVHLSKKIEEDSPTGGRDSSNDVSHSYPQHCSPSSGHSPSAWLVWTGRSKSWTAFHSEEVSLVLRSWSQHQNVANSLSGLNAYLLVACTLIMTLKDVQYIAYSYQMWGEQM